MNYSESINLINTCEINDYVTIEDLTILWKVDQHRIRKAIREIFSHEYFLDKFNNGKISKEDCNLIKDKLLNKNLYPTPYEQYNLIYFKYPETHVFRDEYDNDKNREEFEYITSTVQDFFWKCKNNHSYQTTNHNKIKGIVCPYCVDKTEIVKMLSIDGNYIKYIENPSDEVKLISVKKNGIAIQWINYPSIEMQLVAVRQNAYSIQFIQEPMMEVVKVAINKNPRSFVHIINKYKKNTKEYLLAKKMYEERESYLANKNKWVSEKRAYKLAKKHFSN